MVVLTALNSKLTLNNVTNLQVIEDSGNNFIVFRGNYTGTNNYLQIICNSNTKKIHIAKSVNGVENVLATFIDETAINSKITQNGTANNKLVLCNPSATFTNGVAIVDVSSYIPSGYRGSLPFAVVENSTSLAITGCRMDSNTAVKIDVSNRSYSGTIAVHIMISCVPI